MSMIEVKARQQTPSAQVIRTLQKYTGEPILQIYQKLKKGRAMGSHGEPWGRFLCLTL